MHTRRATSYNSFSWNVLVNRSNLTGFPFTVLPVSSGFEFARKSCALLFFPPHCPACSDPSICVCSRQVQFILLHRLAPLLIYLVVLICFDPSAILSGQIVCTEQSSPAQSAVLQTILELVKHLDAHSEIIPISNGPLSGKQYVWRSRSQTGSSSAEPAMNYITESQECHMFYSPGHGSL